MTNPLRVVIVDDEPLARDALRIRLDAEQGFEVVGEAPDGEGAIALVQSLHPDVLFLDVQMPGLDGFETLREILRSQTPLVVFVTARDDFALRAFDHNAVDYLLKPFSAARFRAALTRVRDMAAARSSREVTQRLRDLLDDVEATPKADTSSRDAGHPARDVPGEAKEHAHGRIVVRDGDRFVLIEPRDVLWCESEGNYVVLRLAATSHRIRGPLKTLESQLPTRTFVRIHRGTLVNIRFVREVEPRGDGDFDVRMSGDHVLRMSRNYRDRLL